MKKIIAFMIFLLSIVNNIHASGIDLANFKIGKRFFSQELYTEAEKRFLEIVRKYPDSEYYRPSLYYLAQTYDQLGQYRASQQYYKIFLNKSQTIKEKQSALLGIANSWLQLGEHDRAAEFYSFFAGEYPESIYAPTALFYAGVAYERYEQQAKAVQKYRQILEMYSSSDYYDKAIEKLAILDNPTAEELLAKSQIINPVKDTVLEDISPVVVTQFIVQETVVTQMIEMPPVIVTQVIPETVPYNEAGFIEQQNPITTQTIEEYRYIWEQEYQQALKEKKLAEAKEATKNMANLLENQEKVLDVKDSVLIQKQNKIKNSTARDLQKVMEAASLLE